MKPVLAERETVRFFTGDRAQRRKLMRSFRGRWDNDGHFIRSAVAFFERHLNKELKLRAYEKKVRR